MRPPTFCSTLTLLFAATALGGCALEGAEPDDAEADEAAVSAALPIKGEWTVVSWQGHYTVTAGSIAERRRVRLEFDARARERAATFDLSSTGEGSIRGIAHCRPSLAPGSDARGGPSRPRADPLTLKSSFFAILQQIWELVETARCDPSQGHEQTIYARRKYDVLGRPSQGLWANLGVYGEGAGAWAADRECRALRGVRWMSFDDGTVACAGYADAAARKVKMLVQNPGEIYVQRLVLQRPGDP